MQIELEKEIKSKSVEQKRKDLALVNRTSKM